jgi:hypothetical protein
MRVPELKEQLLSLSKPQDGVAAILRQRLLECRMEEIRSGGNTADNNNDDDDDDDSDKDSDDDNDDEGESAENGGLGPLHHSGVYDDYDELEIEEDEDDVDD